MFCSKCGAEIADGTKFCSKCGNKTYSESKQYEVCKDMDEPNEMSKNHKKERDVSSDSEKNNDAIVVTSPEPLPNEMLPVRKIYYIFGVCIIIGIFIQVFMGIGALGAMVWYMFDHFLTNYKLSALRTKKFKISDDATIKEIFNKIQAPIISKYGNNFMLEIVEENIVVSYGSYRYDISLNEDSTFSIWWRKTIAKAFFSLSDYKDYRNVLVAMGIIAYEIQHAYDIVE